MCNGIPAFAIADPGEQIHSSTPNKRHPGTTLSIVKAISMLTVLLKNFNIRSAQDQAGLIGCYEDPAACDFRNDSKYH